MAKETSSFSQSIPSTHPHGPHDCYCPSCGYTETVEENVKCNTLYCPKCGDRLRAVGTGEYR